MRLRCVNIPTVHVEEMRGFYSLVLGAPYDGSHGGPDRYEIPAGEKMWVVVCRVSTPVVVHPESCGLEFEVDDVDAEYRRLLQAGVKIESPPTTLLWQWRFVALRDPDGNNVNLVQFVGEKPV